MSWFGLDLRWAYAELLPGISRHTGSMQLSYDVLHDALIRFALTKNPARIEQPQAYMRTIVRNTLLDSLRETSRFVPMVVETETEDGAVKTRIAHQFETELVPSAEHVADLQQRLRAMQKVIDCLPPKCREVFWLFRVEGYSHQEIASKLSISRNMVERHVIRALIDLRTARELVAG